MAGPANGVPTTNCMGSAGIHYANYGPDNLSQTSLGGTGSMGGPLRYHHLQTTGARMGRRVSDGGPYVAAYKLYIEKRNPQLTQIMSATNIEKSEGNHMSSANSVKMLLQEKKNYGGLPHKDWFHYKEQVGRGQGTGIMSYCSYKAHMYMECTKVGIFQLSEKAAIVMW